ncbi:MAG: hypothetical protein OQL18_01025, partial [Deltaproteobacteria bacterium]|nr:hypothetical protein [Deltaproteobacteria bacterium]
IIKRRIEYINRINGKFKSLYNDKEIKEDYRIEYEKYKNKNIRNILNSEFKNIYKKELKYGYTLFGPHIEDFEFFINEKNIKLYSSEGQKKFFLLNYKYAQLLDYYDFYSYYPILLYDDLGSELDEKRKKIYFDRILENSGQIFLTTTNYREISSKDKKVLNIFDGNLTEIK